MKARRGEGGGARAGLGPSSQTGGGEGEGPAETVQIGVRSSFLSGNLSPDPPPRPRVPSGDAGGSRVGLGLELEPLSSCGVCLPGALAWPGWLQEGAKVRGKGVP